MAFREKRRSASAENAAIANNQAARLAMAITLQLARVSRPGGE
jgi:hypothetical protein